MCHEQQLRNTKYRNWVKAGLGLKYLGNGLAPFVDDAVKSQHDDILSDIKNSYGASSRCGLCRLETLLPLHTSGTGNTCPLQHKPSCNCRSTRGKALCPTRLCSAIYDKLIMQHRYLSPSWKNTDVSQWFDNHWQIAKVFIPGGGYQNNVAACDTDCAGLLNIIINNIKMHTLIDTVIDAPNDVFSKTRAARDKIFHSSSLEIEDAELGLILDNMTTILEDEKQLKSTQAAIDAKENIKQLRNQDFVITMYDEESIRKSAMEAINEYKQHALESIDEKQRQVIDEIQAVSHQQKTSTDEIETRVEKTEQTIQFLQQRQAEIEHSIKDVRESHQQLQLVVEEINKELVQMKTDELYSQTRKKHEDQLMYIEKKKALQSDLINLYDKHYRGIPVHPLMKEKELMVDETFVTPILRRIKPMKGHNSQEISFKDIFCSENIGQKNIYITGKAGIGKSALCTKIINEWCKVHGTNNKPTGPGIVKISELTDIAVEMKRFEFLFFVSLRHCKDKISLDDMIKNQLLQTRSYKELFEKITDEDSEKCLIILDGLDEWESTKSKAVPIRNQMAKYTIITTTRPWVLEKHRLKESEIDINVEILEFDSLRSKKLAEIIITHLNVAFKRSLFLKYFEKEILVKDLVELSRIPILLQQMICVWHDEETLGQSQCDIYSSMLNLLIQVADQNERLTPQTDKSESAIFASCMQDKPECLSHEQLILSAAKLAFQTLFMDQQLVFPSSKTEICGMSTSRLDQCLAIGIITQSEAVGISAVTRYKNLAFIHKSFQEYLAALYIALYAFDQNFSKSIFDAIYRSCQSFYDILSLSTVFKFLCGFSPGMGKKISLHIQNVIVEERNREDSLSLSSMYSKSVYEATCGRLMSETNEVIYRMNALFLEWIDEGKRCGHKDIKLVCSEITDLELYENIDQQYVKTLTFYCTDLSSSLAIHHKGPLTGLHISDTSSFLKMNKRFSDIIVQSKETLTELHLDLYEVTSADEKILETIFKAICQLLHLQKFALTNITHTNQIGIDKFSSFLSQAKQLKSLYLENVDFTRRVFPAFSGKPIDLRQYRGLLHLHLLSCQNEFHIPHQIKVICLDAQSVKNTYANFLELSDLQVLSFLPLGAAEPYMSTSFYKDPNVLSALIKAMPSYNFLRHIQISAVDFRGFNLILCQNMDLLLTVVLNNILIEDGRLLAFLKSTPSSSEINRCCSESPCFNDLYIRRLKMVFHDEQDTNTDVHGEGILSDETRKCAIQLMDTHSLVVLQVMKPYKR